MGSCSRPAEQTKVETESWMKTFKWSAGVLAVIMAIYQILFVFTPLWGSSRHNIIHVGFSMAIVLLGKLALQTGRMKRLFLSVLLFASVACMVYIIWRSNYLEMHSGLFLKNIDFIIGAVTIGISLAAILLQWGVVLFVVSVVAVAYFFLGSYIPGVLGFPHLSPQYVMTSLGMGIGTGIFGFIMPVSSTVIFYFMLFSGILSATGVMPMFLEIGKALGTVFRGGASFTAIGGSSLIGSVTGIAAANVAFTGAYTIPTMKSQGFPPHAASAIESVASGGGQIMPPILGTAAFLMSTFIGVPYFVIMVKSIVPALLYYAITIIGTLVMIRHYGIAPGREEVNKALILRRLPVFLVPLGVMIFLLSRAHSASWSVMWAFGAVILVSLFIKDTRPTLKGFFTHFAQGAILGAEIAIGILGIAIVSQTAVTTGLGPKLANLIVSLSHGILPLATLLIMLGCLLLGMGMATAAAYTIVAVVMIPALYKLGVDKFAGHFFALYFAIFSCVTPPIATSALIGSKIAKADFWDCAWEGFRLSVPLFLIPFALLCEPQLLNFPTYGWGALYMILVLLVSGLTIAMLLYRHLLLRLNTFEYAFTLVSTICFSFYIIALQNDLFVLIGMVTAISGVASQITRWKRIVTTADSML